MVRIGGGNRMPAQFLLVEDEEPLLLLVRCNFEAEGYAVDSAMRGNEAGLKIQAAAQESGTDPSDSARR
jgi:CheY-like chemotaxis protein